MEKAAKKTSKKKAGSDAELGTKRHALINSGTEEFDDAGDEYTVLRSRELHQEAMNECGIADAPDLEEILDQRLWLFNKSLDEIFSGEFDRAYISRDLDMALILDDKTLFGNHTEAKKNEQLMSYVVLFYIVYNVKHIFVGLCQPNLAGNKQLTMCEWTEPEIIAAHKMLLKQLDIIEQPNQPLKYGKHCDFCDARFECKEQLKHTYAQVFQDLHPDVKTNANRLNALQLAKKLITDMEKMEHEKALIQMKNGDDLDDWRIKKPRETPSVDIRKAMEILDPILPGETLMDASSISLTKLIKPYQKLKGLKSQAIAKEELKELLGDAITISYGKETVTNK